MVQRTEPKKPTYNELRNAMPTPQRRGSGGVRFPPTYNEVCNASQQPPPRSTSQMSYSELRNIIPPSRAPSASNPPSYAELRRELTAHSQSQSLEVGERSYTELRNGLPTPRPRQLIVLESEHGVNGEYCLPAGIMLTVSKKVGMFEREDLVMEDGNGAEVLRCRSLSLSMSMSQRKDVFDGSGKKMFQIRSHGVFGNEDVAEAPDGSPLFSIKHEVGIIGSSKWNITFNNAIGQTLICWKVKRNHGHTLDVTWNDILVGQITRPKRGITETFSPYHTYTVNVAPNVDYSIMAAMCISYDDWVTRRGSGNK